MKLIIKMHSSWYKNKFLFIKKLLQLHSIIVTYSKKYFVDFNRWWVSKLDWNHKVHKILTLIERKLISIIKKISQGL